MSVILVAPEDARDLIILDHPRTSQPCQFLLTDSDKLYEIISLVSPNKQSILLQDEIIESSPVHIATSFDVIWLLIAELRKAERQERYLEIDELLESFPLRLRILMQAQTTLLKVCDRIDGADEAGFWKLSTTKVVEYIQTRIKRVQAALPPTIIDRLPASTAEILDLAKQKAAFELISSYLEPTLASQVFELYDFAKLSEYLAALKSEVIDPTEFIKRKGEFDEVSTASKKQKKGSKGVEALKKVNTKGMKSMTNFFTKREKATS